MKRDPTSFLRTEYEELVRQGFNWKLRELQGPSTPRCSVDGKELIMLCSNNYLNLSNHPRLIQAAIDAAKSHGAGSGSVRAIAGNMDLHIELERAIARFKKTESALYYQTGFATNAGLITQLAPDKEDLIISDELNHGSIIDGVRLSKAERGVYPHNDMGGLEDILRRSEDKRRVLIVSDGVFSMDGDIAPAKDIVRLANEYGAMTYIDDCHGEGVIGHEGRGIGAHFGIEGKIDVEMGTFSKALGVVGGMIAGSQDLVNFAYNKSRTWLLSGSCPPSTAAACKASIEVLESEPEHVNRLWDNIRYFKKELVSMGFDTGHSETAITPVMCGESHKAKALSEELYGMGVFALPIVFPMVARDKARIRTMMNAGLTKEMLDEALNAFDKGGKRVGII
ncbi:MAG: aminotransferase class I/II-fold pyridoxal phosphate-dependent enzyme [Candidatus Thermoplasmatota archaeon]|nr:aminotransferase class I/II-fold pyridoxal phosphate-dependent enzyme [Candidatus Thermoplasmatota archaeon]